MFGQFCNVSLGYLGTSGHENNVLGIYFDVLFCRHEDLSDVLDFSDHPGADDGWDGDSGCTWMCTGDDQPADQTSLSVSVSQ